jgi:hypothetical protein
MKGEGYHAGERFLWVGQNGRSVALIMTDKAVR